VLAGLYKCDGREEGGGNRQRLGGQIINGPMEVPGGSWIALAWISRARHLRFIQRSRHRRASRPRRSPRVGLRPRRSREKGAGEKEAGEESDAGEEEEVHGERKRRPRREPRRKEALTLKNRRRLSETRALRVLKEVAEALNSAPTEQRAASEALRRMADLLGVQTGWVWLREPASGRFYNAAVQSLPPYLQEPVRMTGRSCWCLELFQSGQLTTRNIDVVECSRLAPAVESQQAALTHGLRCHASVPLYAGNRPLGVMNLAMRGWRRLTRQELDLLTTIADQVGVAIERARLGGQSIERARADERSRMARDVHDTLAQGFTAVALHVEAGLSRLEPHDPARPALQRALDAARQSLDEARRSIKSSSVDTGEPPACGSAGALSREFVQTGVESGRPVRRRSPPADVESELFRIAGRRFHRAGQLAAGGQQRIDRQQARRQVPLVVAHAPSVEHAVAGLG
jgi:two-component system NarL family sensor kinase